MFITVNGNKKEIPQNTTLQAVIEDLDLHDKVMAAAVNMQIVKQDMWEKHDLQENDAVELLDFVGGG